MVTAQLVKELRTKTGMGMMTCKEALTKSGGDLAKAVLYLREKGLSRAAQKSARTTTEGLIVTAVDGQHGAIIEINCETDFVSRNEQFIAFANQLTKQVIAKQIDNVNDLLATEIDGQPVADQLTGLVAKIGENLNIKRLKLFKAEDDGFIADYVHLGGKLGTLVSLGKASGDQHRGLARDLALHVVASAPRYLRPEEVDADEIKQERELAGKKLRESGKPEKIIDKIIDGQMKKFYNEICLLQQPYVKDAKLNVQAFLQANHPQVEIVEFVRFQVGSA